MDLESVETNSEVETEVEVGDYSQLIGNEAEVEEQSGEGQSAEVDPSKAPEEASLEELLGKSTAPEGAKQNTDELLKMINGLGAIHKGLPVEVKSVEEIKEAIQMRHDYTQKTMALAEESRVEREAIAKEREAFKQEHEAFAQERESHKEQLTNYEIFGNVIDSIKDSDPELYAHLEALCSKEVQSFQRQQAYVARESQKFNELHKKLDGVLAEKSQQKAQEIRQGWEKELTEVQAKFAPELTKYGVVPDWKKVQEAWLADANGKMTVVQALDAVHGAAIRAALKSQLQLQETKNKAAQATLSRNSASGSVRKGGDVKGKVETGDYYSMLKDEAI